MRTALSIGLAVLTLQSVRVAASSIDVIVVAEQTASGARIAPPTPEHPTYYVAYDAGYIEAGSAIGGLKPPSAAVISRALRAALGSAGYEAAPANAVPSQVLVYHWGSIRPDFPGKPVIGSNLEARLSLVAPRKMVLQAEEFLVDRRLANAGYVASELRDTLEFAQGAHYFVIISAYDFAALTRSAFTLLWRVRLSTPENSGSIDEALPAMISVSSPYFGRNFDDRQRIAAARPSPDAGGQLEAGPAEAAVPSLTAAGQLEAGLIHGLMRQEHDRFAGEPGSTNLNSGPVLPSALIERIAAYRQEKTALQAILAEKIKPQAAGADTRSAIDAFNSEYSGRILALGQMRERIRSELAQVRAPDSPPTDDQPLDALLREFAIDIRHLEHPPAE